MALRATHFLDLINGHIVLPPLDQILMIQTCIRYCYCILLSYGFFTFTYLLCVTLYGPQFNFILPTQTQSMVTPDQGMSQFDTHESDVEEVPRPAASRKGKEKKVSSRKFNFSKEEDAIICSAFLNVSKDPIIGESPR
jgi:hypothetical protein